MRIAFVTPHQRQGSGGVFTIHQQARHLASTGHDVTVAVVRGDTIPVDGCRVGSVEEAAKDDAYDAVVVPADLPERLPRARRIRRRHLRRVPLPGGPRIWFLQGFGTGSDPATVSNLSRGEPVIAVSAWLRDDAAAAGCPTRLVPCGLDHAVFHPPRDGVRGGERLSVAMMTHRAELKGTAEGLEAIRLAASRVQLDVELFGGVDPEVDAMSFLGLLPQGQVADVLRRANVFVCSSWQEGLGLPGLEAQACGAALVTTDTKGSRDYAVNRSSALVVPPRDPGRLAEALSEIVNDAELRSTVQRGGLKMADSWPSWGESSTRFERAVVDLLT